MVSLLLIIITICCFLFYGVVGQDKTWILAPAFIATYGLVVCMLLQRAWCIGRGAGIEAQREPPQTSNLELPVSGPLFLLFLICGISMIPYAAVPFEAKLRILFIGGVIGAYLIWGAELQAFRDNRLLLCFLISIVMMLALYGLIIHFRAPLSILWGDRYAEYPGRLASTYICPNHFAHLMQMLMPFCLVLLFIPQSGVFLRLLAGYSLAAFLPPLFLTESRAGWLGAIAAIGVTVCLMALRRSRKLFLALVFLVPLCSVLILLAGWRFSETFQRRAEPVVQFLQGQAEDGIGSEARDFRPQTWMDTIDMIKEAPLIGYGPGNYRYTYPEHRKRFRGTRIVTGHPHNEYLELIADFGLIGFGLFALAWCYGLIRVLQASLKADETRHAFIGFAFLGTAAGTMVHSFFDFEMHVFPNALVFALLAAVAWGPLAAVRLKKQRSREPLRSLNPLNVEGDKVVLESGGQNAEDRLKESETPAASIYKPQTANLHRFGAWLLAIGYLLLTVLCLQTMTSAYLRTLADKRSEAQNGGQFNMGSERSKSLYGLAVRIDPQNWRAYKGMAGIIFYQRYYSLDMEEKVQLAEEEHKWNSKAYLHNPKDPELCSTYGKCLIFLGKAEGMGLGAWGRESLNGGAAVMPSADGQKAKQAGIADDASPGVNPKIEQGLDLLRQACRYRLFNDTPWWTLGVELRKLNRYEEALELFRYAQTLNNSRSIQKNIEWLEARLAKQADSIGDVQSVDTAEHALELKPDGYGMSTKDELFDLLDKMSE